MPKQLQGSERAEARRKQRIIFSLLLTLATLVLYNPISRAPFLNYDDNAYVYQNVHVRQGLTWENVGWAFTSLSESNWHPLTWLSHCLDVSLFGLNPSGPHYLNILLHAANAVLLFLLIEGATGLAWHSLAVASLFALHPLNVESVAWIAERKNVLSMLFLLLALGAYGRYVRKPGVRRYLPVLLFFALGLMSKPQVITLPFALLLLDYWPLCRVGQTEKASGRSWMKLVVEKIPLLLLSLGSAYITMEAQTTAMHIELPFAVRLENAAISYAQYLTKIIWPTNLALIYPHPGASIRRLHALYALLGLSISTIAVFLSRRKYLQVGWLWFLGILVPMIGVVQVGVQAMADRYTYIPQIGVFVILCWAAAEFLSAFPRRAIAASTALGIVLLTMAFASSRYIACWRDNITLWTHVLSVTRNNSIAEDSLAEALVTAGKLEEAVPHFRNAVTINPQDPIANLSLGAYEQTKGHYAVAVSYYATVPRLTQNERLLTLALTNSGYAFYSQRRYADAQRAFEGALEKQPGNPQALLGLGLIAQASGNLMGAVRDYENSLRMQPSDVGYLLLGDALERSGQTAGAQAAKTAAERISSNIDAATAESRRLLVP